MKKLAWILMFCCTAAYSQSAEWVARANNKGGGLLVLLAEKAKCTTGLRMYGANREGAMLWGCWFATDSHILVNWDDGATSAYDYKGWEVNPVYRSNGDNNRGKPKIF